MSITCTLMASFAMVPTVFNTYEKCYRHFRPKTTSQKTFLIPRFVLDMINYKSNWTSCRTIQGVIMLKISNRPRTCLILRGIEWSLRALASMRAVHLFLRARAVIKYVLRAASTFKLIQMASSEHFVNFLGRI